MNSKFIVIEGLEGAGKTSAVSEVANILHHHGVDNIVFTREPGGTPIAEAIRNIIKYSIDNEPVTDYAELLMLYAARVQLVKIIIKPALARGSWVVGDRYVLSSYAYQGGGRGIDERFLQTLHSTLLNNFRPDLTLYLDIPPEISLIRTYSRRETDRIELESVKFFERTRSRYIKLATSDNRVIIINANAPIKVVKANIRLKLIQWLHSQTD